MFRLFANPRYLLPFMIFVGVLVVGTRVSDVWDAATNGTMFPPLAHAEAKGEAPAKTDAPAAGNIKEPESTKAIPTSPPPDEADVSPGEMQVLEQLSARRDELDKRGKALDTRESLIKIAEQRVDQKIKEMETLRLQLQGMVSQASEAQAVQLDNLVKIYETMKPEEAARIFETLDMPVLLGVIQRMKPKSTAPIMAKMAPEKAKDITIALTKQDQLPQVK